MRRMGNLTEEPSRLKPVPVVDPNKLTDLSLHSRFLLYVSWIERAFNSYMGTGSAKDLNRYEMKKEMVVKEAMRRWKLNKTQALAVLEGPKLRSYPHGEELPPC